MEPTTGPGHPGGHPPAQRRRRRAPALVVPREGITNPDTDDGPCRVEVRRAFRWWDFAVFVLLSVVSAAAIANFVIVWLANGDLPRHPVLFVLVTVTLLLILFNQQGRWYLLLFMRRPVPIPAPPGLRAAVVTTCVPDAEPIDMLERSLRALVAIEYPHDTWLLDEGDDPAVRALCERLGVRHFTRLHRPEYQQAEGPFRAGSKYGNYNAWLDAVGYASYDVLAAFDPDHVPHPRYLHRMLGYLRDPRVGYVQAAQAYYNQEASVVARGAAEETYAYYSTIQMASYGMGYPILVGSHNVHRMTALREVGGIAQHDADDLLLTLRYRAAGWQGVYVPEILARGLAPVDWRGYLVQQRRWARSVLDVKFRRRGRYASRLPFHSRLMSLLHGINFMHRSVAGALGMAVLIWMLLIGGTHNFLRVEMVAPVLFLVGALQLSELYRQRFYLDWKTERGLHWASALLEYVKWPWFGAAVLDVLLDRRHSYTITWKAGRRGVYRTFILVHVAIAFGVGIPWMIGVFRNTALHPLFEVAGWLVVTTSLGLLVTELRGFPPPFDAKIWRTIRDPDAT